MAEAEPLELVLPLLEEEGAALWTARRGDERVRAWVVDPTGAGPAAVSATRRDLQTVQTISHPALLQVTHVGTLSEGRLFATVDFAIDRGLDEILAAEGPPPLQTVLEIARSVCGGLAALHREGVVHGGLHAAHVRFPRAQPDSTPPVLTGGGWCALRVAWMTCRPVSTHTLRHCAPEIALGLSAQPDRLVDIFGLGCLLTEILTGKPAFNGETVHALRTQLASPDRPDLRQQLGPAEEQLAAVIRRCLSPDPQLRYASITSLWRELAPALGGRADPLLDAGPATAGATATSDGAAQQSEPARGAATPAQSTEEATPPARGSIRWTVGLALLSALATVVILVFTWPRESRDRDSRRDRTTKPSAGLQDGSPTVMAPAERPSTPGPRPQPGHAKRVAMPAPDPMIMEEEPPPSLDTLHRERLAGIYKRVGMQPEELVIEPGLAHQHARALAAITRGDARSFQAAVTMLAQAIRPGRCRTLRRLKRHYIIRSIRKLGSRLSREDRLRIEGAMRRNAGRKKGHCAEKNGRYTPLVLEMKKRLAGS